MKKIFFVSISFLLINYCCDVNDSAPQIAGNYEGAYSLTEYLGKDSVSIKKCLMKIEFTDRTYKCESDSFFVLPGGGGRYIVDFNSITLTDTVGHQQDIDPNFLLKGKFNFTKRGDVITFNQNITHKFQRQAKLTKQD